MLKPRRPVPTAKRIGSMLVLVGALVGGGCAGNSTPDTAAELPDGPTRLVLEPGDDPAEVTDQLATPPSTAASDVDDAPSESLASTGEAAPDVSVPDEPAPSDDAEDAGPTDTIAAPPTAAGFDELASELTAFVEGERGRTFDAEPDIRRLDAAGFRAAVSALVDADLDAFADQLDAQTRLHRALGILGPDQDLAEIQRSFGDAGIVAIYAPNEGAILVRDQAITPLVRTSLVHELTRALDDQAYGLRAGEPTAGTESAWIRGALFHGSAAEIAARYRATMTDAERAEEVAELESLPRNVSLALFTDSFLELQFGRQFYGELAVADLWSSGQAAVDAALADPPRSSEQIITGDLADAPDTLAVPPADGATVASGVFGQAGWIALFSDLVAPEDAEALSTGWGGDAWVVWEVGTVECARLHIAADSADALDRYAETLTLWAAEGDRQIFYPTADLIRVTACA